jgi:hypothetical protein
MVSHHFEVARNSFDKRDQDNIQFGYRSFDRLFLNGRIRSLRAIRAAITISYNLDKDCQIETAGVNMASMSDVHRYVLYFSRLLGWSGYLIAAYALWKIILVLESTYRKKGETELKARESLGWQAILALALIPIVFFGSSRLTRYASKRVLAGETQRLSSELVDFSNSRAQRTQRNPDETFEQYRNRIVAEDRETRSLYAELYYRKIATLRDEYARRGLTDMALDEFYHKPVHPLGIREVAERLTDMRERLESR